MKTANPNLHHLNRQNPKIPLPLARLLAFATGLEISHRCLLTAPKPTVLSELMSILGYH